MNLDYWYKVLQLRQHVALKKGKILVKDAQTFSF